MCVGITEEEEVEIKAVFGGEAAGDKKLHDPTMIVNAENQVPVAASAAIQPTTGRDFNVETSANQSEVTLSKIRMYSSQSFVSGKKSGRSCLEQLRKSMVRDVTKIRKLTISFWKKNKAK